MKLFLIFLLLNLINCAENTFKIDFSFLLPDYNTTNLIGINSDNDNLQNSKNKSFLQNINYYQNIRPLTKICLGDPFQCFQIPITFNFSETIFDLNLVAFFYRKSSSFSLLAEINDSILHVSDRIKFGKRAKSVLSEYNFILINKSNSFFPIINAIGLGKSKLFNNYTSEKDLSLVKQLRDKKLIETSELIIEYKNDFSGKITLGTDYFGMGFHESLYLELPNNENSFNGFLQSIYIVDTTITSTKNQKIDLLEKEKRKRIVIDFNSTFITFGEEIFEKLKTISFNSYINAGICNVKKEEISQIQYIVCKDDILNSNLDKLIFIINPRKNIAINLNDLFLPYQDENDKKSIILGIISGNNKETINIGTVLLKKYILCLNREKNSIRLYLKNISGEKPTDFFGIGGIILLTTIICLLIIYMVTTICGKDKYEPNYSPKTQKFLSKKNLDTSMQSNESL